MAPWESTRKRCSGCDHPDLPWHCGTQSTQQSELPQFCIHLTQVRLYTTLDMFNISLQKSKSPGFKQVETWEPKNAFCEFTAFFLSSPMYIPSDVWGPALQPALLSCSIPQHSWHTSKGDQSLLALAAHFFSFPLLHKVLPGEGNTWHFQWTRNDADFPNTCSHL